MFKEIFIEGKNDYIIYHDSYTSAIQSAELYANNQGYTLDAEEMADKIGLGPKRPSKGKTNKFTLDLYKNGKMINNKFKFHFQVYNRGTSSNTYELNCYIA